MKHIISRLRYKLLFTLVNVRFNEYLYLRIHSSTSAGSQTFSTVQFEYQKGKLPFSNLFPFGHLYLENSLSYHNQPPSSIGGGRSAQGSTEINFMCLDFCLQYIKRPHLNYPHIMFYVRNKTYKCTLLVLSCSMTYQIGNNCRCHSFQLKSIPIQARGTF